MKTVDERTLKEKWESLKWRAKQEKKKVVRFCNEHPEAAFLGASTVIGTVSYAGKKVFKSIGVKKEMRLLECKHYDRRTDTYWFSKRPLKTSEKLMMERMYTEGLSKGEILQRMGLLK